MCVGAQIKTFSPYCTAVIVLPFRSVGTFWYVLLVLDQLSSCLYLQYFDLLCSHCPWHTVHLRELQLSENADHTKQCF